MKVPLSWLRELVQVDVPVSELAHRLTMAGLEVEDVHVVGSNWRDVSIGRVTSLERHPRLDSLNVVGVDLGGRTTTVVSGAPNLEVGQVVPYVAPGGRLPRMDVGARTFGGITSEGMVCSGDELDISPDKDGIYIFEAEASTRLGMPVSDYLQETVLDIYINANRPDCMSMLGLAREVHALFNAPYLPAFQRLIDPVTATVSGSAGAPRAADVLEIRIDDAVGCPRFTASVVRGMRIGPSPHWLQRRLHFAGVRPISNVVDATNYVMLEVGQPLHAFDRERLGSNSIVVRRAHAGERLRTLDGEDRVLNASMMVVTDGQRARSLAGIMGGEDSEIADTTNEVVLEGASWDRASIRLTSGALTLATEASRRFGRGVDPDLTALGVARATQLTLELGGGTALAGLVDEYPGKSAPRVIRLAPSYVATLLGTPYTREQTLDTLDALGFGLEPVDADAYDVTVPGWRRFDVEGRADLAEEVARIVGFDQVPATMLRGEIPAPRPEGDGGFADELRARRTLASAGLTEIITYSLVDPGQPALLSAVADAESEPAISIANPQSAEQSVLRTTLLGSILAALRSNFRQRERVLVFELARTWHGQLDPLPDERRHVGIAMAGPRTPRHWSGDTTPLDFFDLKGVVDTLCQAFGVRPSYARATHPSLHPGRTAEVTAGGHRLGILGELHPTVMERFDIAASRVVVAELDFERILQARQPLVNVATPSRFPPADRDVSFFVDPATPHAELESAIRDAAGPLLERLELFDVYSDPSVSAGRKSLAYALRYRAPDRTLDDDEVTAAHGRVEEMLRTRFGGEVRGR